MSKRNKKDKEKGNKKTMKTPSHRTLKISIYWNHYKTPMKVKTRQIKMYIFSNHFTN